MIANHDAEVETICEKFEQSEFIFYVTYPGFYQDFFVQNEEKLPKFLWSLGFKSIGRNKHSDNNTVDVYVHYKMRIYVKVVQDAQTLKLSLLRTESGNEVVRDAQTKRDESTVLVIFLLN